METCLTPLKLNKTLYFRVFDSVSTSAFYEQRVKPQRVLTQDILGTANDFSVSNGLRKDYVGARHPIVWLLRRS